jgi:hypothetical protein
VTGTNTCLQSSSCCAEVQDESKCQNWVNHHDYTTLHHCYCGTHPVSLLLRDSYCITAEAWLILHYCYYVTRIQHRSSYMTHTALLLMRDSYCINVYAWLMPHYCYCVTHMASLLMLDSPFIAVTAWLTALLLMHDSYYITVTAWLINNIALSMWLILHQLLRDS